MSLEHIKNLIYNKYDEIYNKKFIHSEPEISIDLENFIYELLEKYDENKVMYFIKELFDIEIDNTIDNELEYSNKICRNDTEFRKAIWERDQNCILCDSNSGECDEIVYEVAHIYNFAECETDKERYDPYNGILLCANMHKRFDKNILDFVVNETTVNAIFCEDMKNSSIYKKYNGKEMTNFTKGNLYYLEKRKGMKRNEKE